MRKQYHEILKKWFQNKLIRHRYATYATQSEMAEKLAMDERSYIDLEHGKTCCSAVTLALFLTLCSDDPMGLLEELRCAFEAGIYEAA